MRCCIISPPRTRARQREFQDKRRDSGEREGGDPVFAQRSDAERCNLCTNLTCRGSESKEWIFLEKRVKRPSKGEECNKRPKTLLYRGGVFEATLTHNHIPTGIRKSSAMGRRRNNGAAATAAAAATTSNTTATEAGQQVNI